MNEIEEIDEIMEEEIDYRTILHMQYWGVDDQYITNLVEHIIPIVQLESQAVYLSMGTVPDGSVDGVSGIHTVIALFRSGEGNVTDDYKSDKPLLRARYGIPLYKEQIESEFDRIVRMLDNKGVRHFGKGMDGSRAGAYITIR